MERPSYLSKYLFDWEMIEQLLGGKSALDSKYFIGPMPNVAEVNSFLAGYGIDPGDPVGRAELFGNFQEAIQFIKRYFLIEGSADGLDLKIPNSVLMVSEIRDLFLMATSNIENADKEDTLWAEIILKVMHTILHVDKDLRSNYFSVIQTQIFDRYYKYLYRNEGKQLNLGVKGEDERIPLLDFETKSKKTRDSAILKLLHKAENVAEELFDRIGIRIITYNKFDALRVVKFLLEKYIVIPHNVKPSRSFNTMLNLESFKEKHSNLLKMALRNNLSEERFMPAMDREAEECLMGRRDERNEHSRSSYHSFQFTCRQLIKYKNPFLQDFYDIRKMAKGKEDDLAKKVLNMDVSLISRDIRFFYPYEIQIVDEKSHVENSEGEASHQEYKKSQIKAARDRIFSSLMEYKGIGVYKAYSKCD